MFPEGTDGRIWQSTRAGTEMVHRREDSIRKAVDGPYLQLTPIDRSNGLQNHMEIDSQDRCLCMLHIEHETTNGPPGSRRNFHKRRQGSPNRQETTM